MLRRNSSLRFIASSFTKGQIAELPNIAGESLQRNGHVNSTKKREYGITAPRYWDGAGKNGNTWLGSKEHPVLAAQA